MRTIETDYLVVGAGAVGMAFADSLVTSSESEVVLVDRRHQPGGHWNDAYPFVRLHQPSASYGVNSRNLGDNSIDAAGRNAGKYERATGPEICGYFQRVLDEQLVPSGQVRFFGLSDYVGDLSDDHRFVRRATGEEIEVRVRRRVVDATYLEPSIPANHKPSFGTAPGVRVVTPNALAELGDAGSGFTIIGGGKTAMDVCLWLLDNGVGPESLRWIRPRDSWLLERTYFQPLDGVVSLIDGLGAASEAAVEAESAEDLFRRLEAHGQLVRLDPRVEPTMYHCATVSQDEVADLRSIDNVVRQGRVRHVGSDRLEMEDGSLSTDPGQIYVDCSASGLHMAPARPIFEPGRITLQQVRTCQPPFNAAIVAFIEQLMDDDRERNRLCPPNPYPNTARDWLWNNAISQRAQLAWNAEPDVAAWMETARLNLAGGLSGHMDDPRMQAAFTRYATYAEPAIACYEALFAEAGQRVG